MLPIGALLRERIRADEERDGSLDMLFREAVLDVGFLGEVDQALDYVVEVFGVEVYGLDVVLFAAKEAVLPHDLVELLCCCVLVGVFVCVPHHFGEVENNFFEALFYHRIYITHWVYSKREIELCQLSS
jgi:hypothetical protein